MSDLHGFWSPSPKTRPKAKREVQFEKYKMYKMYMQLYHLVHRHTIAHVRHLKEAAILHSAWSLNLSTSIRVPDQQFYANQMFSSHRSARIVLPSTNWFCVNRSASVSCIGIGNASLLCSPLDLRCHRKGIVLEELQQFCVLKKLPIAEETSKDQTYNTKKRVLLNESS